MSNGFPYWQFHCDRWLTGKIESFDLDEQALYLHLCMQAWSSGGAFNVCSTLVAKRYRKTADWVAATLAAFTECGITVPEGNGYRIKFIDAQLEDLHGIRDKRSAAGRASAQKRREERTDKKSKKSKKRIEEKDVEQVFNTCSTDVAFLSFDRAWAAYGKHGSKAQALAYWRALSEADRAAVEAAIPAYLKCVEAGRAKLDMMGFLNPQKRKWETDWTIILAELTRPVPARQVEQRSWLPKGTGGL
jgi:hypothetical protein